MDTVAEGTVGTVDVEDMEGTDAAMVVAAMGVEAMDAALVSSLTPKPQANETLPLKVDCKLGYSKLKTCLDFLRINKTHF